MRCSTDFVDRIGPGGFLVACADDPGAAPLVARAHDRGLPSAATGTPSRPTPACSSSPRTARAPACAARLGGEELALRLAVPGEHMALNALARAAGRRRAGRAPRLPRRGAGRLRRRAAAVRVPGPGRRRRRLRRLRPPPDRGRRPAAGRAGRSPGAGGWSSPSSRTCTPARATFADAFGAALGLADEVVVLDVYGAREDPEPGVTGALVADAVPLPARARALRAAVGGGARGARRRWPARATW